MTNEKPKADVLYFDENRFQETLSDLERVKNKVIELAAIWDKQEILPTMNQQIFQDFISQGTKYLDAEFEKSLSSMVDGKLPGLMKFLNTVEPQVNHPELENILREIKSFPALLKNLIAFNKSGKPVISPMAESEITRSCTVYGSKENSELLKLLQSYADAHNNLLERFENPPMGIFDMISPVSYLKPGPDGHVSLNWAAFQYG